MRNTTPTTCVRCGREGLRGYTAADEGMVCANRAACDRRIAEAAPPPGPETHRELALVVDAAAQVEQAKADYADARARARLADEERARVRAEGGDYDTARQDARQADQDRKAARARLEDRRAVLYQAILTADHAGLVSRVRLAELAGGGREWLYTVLGDG